MENPNAEKEVVEMSRVRIHEFEQMFKGMSAQEIDRFLKTYAVDCEVEVSYLDDMSEYEFANHKAEVGRLKLEQDIMARQIAELKAKMKSHAELIGNMNQAIQKIEGSETEFSAEISRSMPCFLIVKDFENIWIEFTGGRFYIRQKEHRTTQLELDIKPRSTVRLQKAIAECLTDSAAYQMAS